LAAVKGVTRCDKKRKNPPHTIPGRYPAKAFCVIRDADSGAGDLSVTVRW